MKKGDTFQLSYSWWDKEGAKTLPKTGLGKALKDFEKAYAEYDKQNPVNGIELLRKYLHAVDCLAQVDEARKKAISLCKDSMHKETKSALSTGYAIPKIEIKIRDDVYPKFSRLVSEAEDELEVWTKSIKTAEEVLKRAKTENDDKKEKSLAGFEELLSSIGHRQGNINQSLTKIPSIPAFKKNFSELHARTQKVRGSVAGKPIDELLANASIIFGKKLNRPKGL